MVYDTFTAANTERGFRSFFDEITGDERMKRVFLIKGGPGCGKSTLMKRLAAEFEGETVERIHCSSDPHSLDGVYLRDRGVAVLDATAPHAADMTVPGAYESLIDLSRFWDVRRLAERREEIAGLFTKISAAYKPVYSLLRAAGALDRMQGELFDGYTDGGKLARYAARTAREYGRAAGRREKRLLSAFGGDGVVRFGADALCDGYVLLDDGINAADAFMRRVLDELDGCGVTVILSPLCPDRRIEGLILRKERIGIFAAGHPFTPEIAKEKVIKRINTRIFANAARRAEVKNRLAFSKKLTAELIAGAARELRGIKAMHDGLEKYYVDAMDFGALDGYAEEVTEIIKKS